MKTGISYIFFKILPKLFVVRGIEVLPEVVKVTRDCCGFITGQSQRLLHLYFGKTCFVKYGQGSEKVPSELICFGLLFILVKLFFGFSENTAVFAVMEYDMS